METSKNPQWKQLLLAIVAICISILLTFGTAACIQHRQKVKNTRQTVLMAIKDIDSFKSQLQMFQDEYFIKWGKDIEELQSLSRESILKLSDQEREKYWEALVTPLSLTRNKIVENIFSNDINLLQEIGNFSFIQKVGDGYSLIADIEKNIKIKMDEKGEIEKYFDTNYDWKSMSDGERLVTFMNLKEVKRYMDDLCGGFIPYIHYSIEDVGEYVDECMKMMNVSEEELAKQ